ncbi:hypothetical protein JCM6882_003553 [Rhodosporidiobolus microsporus]
MGLGDVLGLTKSATFQATVEVHELVQVPLLHARFKVKWKFKGATTVAPTDGDESASSLSHSHSGGFGKRFLHPRSALHNVTSNSNNGTLPSTSSSGGLSSSGGAGGGSMTRSRSGSPAGRGWDSAGDDDVTSGGEGIVSPSRSPPLSPEGAGGRTPNPNRTPAANNGNPTFAFTSPFSANSETLYTHGRSGTYDTVGTDDTGLSSSVGRRRGAADAASAPALAAVGGKDATAGAHRALPKGSTSYVPLRSHTATFNRTICCPVQIPLRHLPANSLSVRGSSKAKYQLQPSPVRLSVKQEVLTEERKREEVKLGEVVLDLSQFVGRQGSGGKECEQRSRRYLLQDCKSNAVLKVSVKMELIDGDAAFIAPPLKSGQIPTTAAAVKGLHSSQNSPMNRSTVSLGKSPASASASSANLAAGRLSTSTFSTSHSSNASTPNGITRTNSMSSTGTGESRNSSGGQQFPGLTARTGSAGSAGHGKKGKKKGWHPPHAALALASASSALLSTSASACMPSTAHTTTPSFALGSSTGSSGPGGDRAASDVIDAIFNRPQRTPSWVGFSTASRPPTPGLGDGGEAFPSTPTPNGMLGNPFEYDPTQGRGRKNRRSAPPGLEATSSSGGEKDKATGSGKAWSIRSGIERHKEKKREKEKEQQQQRDGREGADRRPQLRVQGSAGVTDDERDELRTPRPTAPAGFKPSVQVQPPTPQTSFSASVASHQPPSRPPPPVPRPASAAFSSSSTTVKPPPRPASLASSVGPNGRALSVRWGDAPTPSSSASNSPQSTAASTLPSSYTAASSTSGGDRRSLRHSKSNDSTMSSSARSVLSTRSQRSQKDFNPGLGLSSTTPSATPSPASTPASSAAPSPEKVRDLAQNPAGGSTSRPPSQLSFNSVVTPPSPEKKPAGQKEKEKEREKEGKKKVAPGEKAPGGMDWGKSWG